MKENPDGEENQEAYKQHRREVFGLQMIAAATAHRACGNQEQDTQNGKHAPDDDTPYDVDGVSYCGRCHHAL